MSAAHGPAAHEPGARPRLDAGLPTGPAAGVLAGSPGAPAEEAGAGPDRKSACCSALSEDLGWALGAVFRAYLKAAKGAFADVPGGARGYQVLAAAARSHPGSQLELAQHLGVDRTVMTYLLDDLEGAGLIERRPDPADRRARRIQATAPGRELLEGLALRLRTADQQVLAGLPDDADRRAFRVLLRRLAVSADAPDPGPGACETGQRAGTPDPAILPPAPPAVTAPGSISRT